MNEDTLIAGGGIGGLTAAIALHRAGLPVQVHERAPEIREVGAGITLQANAALALRRIGLDRAVMEAGRPIGTASIRRWDGTLLSGTDFREIETLLGAPSVAIHRATLQKILLEALSPGILHAGSEIAGYEAGPDGVEVRLGDGRRIAGAALVGADGIHSAVRAQLLGDGDPLYAGYVSWRGVTPEDFHPAPQEVSESWGPGRRFGIVPVEKGRVYWFATLNTPPGGRDEPGQSRATLLRLFEGWHPPIQALLEATPEEAILRNDILHRMPVRTWGEGRVTLLGDAAHPMTPNLGQGAGQAIEDAVVLAECLRGEPDIPAALRRYEARRIPRANGFVLGSLRLGRLAQWENGFARGLRDRLIAWTPASVAKRQMVRSLAFEG
jgi:2-polyprenyl-6-methoxyphenol hydroxylase-like FAD-dependent oxidoreductase